MAKFAWSYSALTLFETCPKKFYHQRVAKDFKDTQSSKGDWGQDVHKALEKRLKEGVALPAGMASYEPMAGRIEAAPGNLFTEQQLAINQNFEPTEWFARDVWCRAIVDVMKLNNTKAFIGDYKTGKIKPDSDQLKLSAAITMAHYPVNTITTTFIWLKHDQITPEVYTRDQLSAMWNSFLPRVKRLDIAYEESKWPSQPNFLCKGYCPITTCPHNGRYSGR